MKYTDEELEEIQKNIVYLKDRELSDCIFGFACFTCAAVGIGEDYDDFSLLLFENGNLEYNEYLCIEIPKKTRVYYVDTKYVLRIKEILKKHSDDISVLEDTDNDLICDGSYEYFIFSGKMTNSYNIWAIKDYSDDDEENCSSEYEMNCHDGYSEQHRKDIIIERKKLEIFCEITDVLKEAGVFIDFGGVRFSIAFRTRTIRHPKSVKSAPCSITSHKEKP